MHQNGIDPLLIVQDLLEVVHLVTKFKVHPLHIEDSISDFEKQKSVELAKQIPMVQLGRAWQMLLKGIAEVQSSSSPFSALEMLTIRVVYLAEKREDTSLRRVVTDVSTAWAIASNPAAAVTLVGCDSVNSGSSSAIAKANCSSPQAILTPVFVSAITA